MCNLLKEHYVDKDTLWNVHFVEKKKNSCFSTNDKWHCSAMMFWCVIWKQIWMYVLLIMSVPEQDGWMHLPGQSRRSTVSVRPNRWMFTGSVWRRRQSSWRELIIQTLLVRYDGRAQGTFTMMQSFTMTMATDSALQKTVHWLFCILCVTMWMQLQTITFW